MYPRTKFVLFAQLGFGEATKTFHHELIFAGDYKNEEHMKILAQALTKDLASLITDQTQTQKEIGEHYSVCCAQLVESIRQQPTYGTDRHHGDDKQTFAVIIDEDEQLTITIKAEFLLPY